MLPSILACVDKYKVHACVAVMCYDKVCSTSNRPHSCFNWMQSCKRVRGWAYTVYAWYPMQCGLTRTTTWHAVRLEESQKSSRWVDNQHPPLAEPTRMLGMNMLLGPQDGSQAILFFLLPLLQLMPTLYLLLQFLPHPPHAICLILLSLYIRLPCLSCRLAKPSPAPDSSSTLWTTRFYSNKKHHAQICENTTNRFYSKNKPHLQICENIILIALPPVPGFEPHDSITHLIFCLKHYINSNTKLRNKTLAVLAVLLNIKEHCAKYKKMTR